jgi:hypothetical protein
MLYVLVFIVFSDFMVRGGFVDIDGIVEYKNVCKLQHGKIEII